MNFIPRTIRNIFKIHEHARHQSAIRTIIRHSTLRKLVNLLLVETEFRLRSTRVYGRPYILSVDPTNICNLRCPLCPTGTHEQGRKGTTMTWQTFQHTVDMAAPYAYKVNFFNWGEPLLHPRLFDMIRYANDNNIGTTLSSNFSVELDDETIDHIITSGLEFLTLSIDGASQSTYSIYRKKGDLDLVLSNLARLVKRRTELNSKTPVIEWQFLPMKHNEHEEETARQLAMSMEVDVFRCIPVGLPFWSTDRPALREQWYPAGDRHQHSRGGIDITRSEKAETSCYFLYRYLTVNPDGKISPCCVTYGEDTDFADIHTDDIPTLMNNAQYRSARSLYRKNGQVIVPTACDSCHLFVKHASRAGHPQSIIATD